MILTGNKIEEEIKAGRIVFSPFLSEQLNPNSIDIRLGPDYIIYNEAVIDPSRENSYQVRQFNDEGSVFESGNFILGASLEIVGSDNYVPILHGKSTTARAGLFIHVTADLIDLGSVGCLTLQMYMALPIRLYPGMSIGQVSFWVPSGERSLYEGKYKNSNGPRASEIHKDPFWKNRGKHNAGDK